MDENKDLERAKIIAKEKFDIFAKWISSLSWGKFIVFIILTSIISTKFQELFISNDNNWLNSLTGIFIFVSIAIKLLMTNKVKTDKKVDDALSLAEKETLLRQLSDAKVQVMQAQIEPHFLFNTLSSLQYLIESDPIKANKVLGSLIKYLRYALPQIRENKATSTIEKEIENISAYLSIMEIRMGDRLKYDFKIPSNLLFHSFPVMMLQPIVENAIKYGIEESIKGGSIHIEVKEIDNNLYLSVIDTGAGLDTKKVMLNKGNGMALQNIKERLELLYGNNASFSMEPHRPQGVVVTISIPL